MINMRERKYIKLKVNMYDDTKFKIIDMKIERDLIHYVWTRIVVLAGKVNLAGDLYMFGANLNGELGLGDRKRRNILTQVSILPKKQVKFVSCGGSHTGIINENNDLYMFGNNLVHKFSCFD